MYEISNIGPQKKEKKQYCRTFRLLYCNPIEAVTFRHINISTYPVTFRKHLHARTIIVFTLDLKK